MTIKDVINQYFENGEIDQDVCDTEIDVAVALCYTLGDENDAYEKLLKLLVENVVVERYLSNDTYMECDFSGYFRIYREKLIPWANKYLNREFDDNEVEYDMAQAIEGLIAGYFSESAYSDLIKILK